MSIITHAFTSRFLILLKKKKKNVHDNRCIAYKVRYIRSIIVIFKCKESPKIAHVVSPHTILLGLGTKMCPAKRASMGPPISFFVGVPSLDIWVEVFVCVLGPEQIL